MPTILLKLLPFTSRSKTNIADVDEISITPTGTRTVEPYPPGKVQINGEYWPEIVENDAVLTWTHRIRTAQVETAVVHQDAESTPGSIEGSYKVEVLIDGTVVIARTQTGIVGTSFTYPMASRLADNPDPDKMVQFRIAPINGDFVGRARTTDPFLMVETS